MSIIDEHKNCSTTSNHNKFGLCDKPSPDNSPAYIDEENEHAWLATVLNKERYNVFFTAIDNCIEIQRADGRQAKRCDGVLHYDATAIFIELKDRKTKGSGWIKDAEEQLRQTIYHFEQSENMGVYTQKKAYISNPQKPYFRSSQRERMDRFFGDVAYVLRIEAVITLL